MNQKDFESAVQKAVANTPDVFSAVVREFSVFATHKSDSTQIRQVVHLIFDKNGNYLAGYGNPTDAAPKLLVKNIINSLK